MKRIVLLLCVLSVIVAGCSGKSPVSSAGAQALSPAQGSSEQPEKHLPRHKPADHQVVVMLGSEYAKRPAVLDAITTEYGLSGFGGMMVKLLYPESFKAGGPARLSVLSDCAAKSGVTIVVTVGAPEGTIYALNRIRAVTPGMKIVSLFPLDDALPVEAVSDIVADFPSPKEILANENASSGSDAASGSASISDASIGLLILASTLAEEGTTTDTPLARLDASLEIARSLMKLKKAEAQWNLALWVDPDTGLKSHNHLVLDYKGERTE